METDLINHPPHYTSHPSGIECIQVTEHMSFCLGNAIKYIWRADEKGTSLDDLRKATWYLNREIDKREREAARVKALDDFAKSELVGVSYPDNTVRPVVLNDVYPPDAPAVFAEPQPARGTTAKYLDSLAKYKDAIRPVAEQRGQFTRADTAQGRHD